MGSKKKSKVKKTNDKITPEVTKKTKETINDKYKKELKEKELLEKTLQGLKEESDINPDLENFFEKVKEEQVKEENQEHEIVQEEVNNTKEAKVKKKVKDSKFKTFLLIIAFILSILYYLLYIKDAINSVNYIRNIINSSSLLLTFFLIVVALLGNKKTKNIFSGLSSVIIIGILVLNILVSKDVVTLPTREIVKDFTNTSLSEVMKWASSNEIKLVTNYEYSDNIPESNIISQNKKEGTVANTIKELEIVVSNGPNYDKELVLTNFVGLSANELIEFIDKNHLNNVEINYEINNDTDKDIIISQSTKGEIKRNTKLTFKISLGKKEDLKDIDIENQKNKKLFDATLYLKRNGIKYEISYEFSSKIKKDYVISQDPEKGKVKPNEDTVKLVISKGKEIIVPDFSGKTVDDVVSWIIKNNLKVAFAEKHSTTVNKDGLISVSVNKGDSITEGTKITITTSNGALTVPEFKSLAEYRSFVSNNGINSTEKFEYSDTVSKGNIISLSIKSGEKIDPEKQGITVTISYGKAVTVPYFVGKSKSSIQSQCNNLGLYCTFYSTGFSSTAKDVATKQSVSSGAKVISGSTVSIGLSSGQPANYTLTIGSELFGTSCSSTISSLKSWFASNAPGVNVNISCKSANSGMAGLIHPDSPIKGGVPKTYTQGQTYTIYVIS